MEIQNVKKFLSFFVAIVIVGFAVLSSAQENSNAKNIFEDSDQDGLSNEEEIAYGTDANKADTDNDGYSDDAEIKSGYDPLKPAPGDRITTDTVTTEKTTTEAKSTDSTVPTEPTTAEDKNLTEDVSVQVAELITKNSSENKPITMEELDAIATNALEGELTFEELPEIDAAEIKTKKQNYTKYSDEKRKELEKMDTLQYLTAVSYIAASNSPQKISTVDDVEKMATEFSIQMETSSTSFFNSNYFLNLISKSETAKEQLKEVEVPENMLDMHIRGLKLFNYASSLKNEPISETDPIKGLTSLSKIQQFIGLSSQFSEDVNKTISEMGIIEIPLDL